MTHEQFSKNNDDKKNKLPQGDASLPDDPALRAIIEALPVQDTEFFASEKGSISIGNVKPEQITDHSSEIVEAAVVEQDGAIVLAAFDSAKNKRRESGKYSEDAVGARQVVDDEGVTYWVLSASDGMSGTPNTHALAQGLSRHTALRGTPDLVHNVEQVAQFAQSMDDRLGNPDPDEMLNNAMSTFDQISINTVTGEVTGISMSDGFTGFIQGNRVSLLDGDFDSLLGGMAPSRYISTGGSNIGHRKSLQDLITQPRENNQTHLLNSENKVVLAKGDIVFLMSDNLERIEIAGDLDTLIEAIKGNNVDEIKRLFEKNGGDDSSLIYYVHH